MNKLLKVKFSGTTDSSGDLELISTQVYRGKAVAVFVDIGTWTGSAVDVTITGNDSGSALYTGTNLAGDTVAAATANAYLFNEKIKCVIADGGNVLTGDVYVLLE